MSSTADTTWTDPSGRTWCRRPEPLPGGTDANPWWYANLWFAHADGDDPAEVHMLVRVETRARAQILIDDYFGRPKPPAGEIASRIQRWTDSDRQSAPHTERLTGPPAWLTQRTAEGRIAVPEWVLEQPATQLDWSDL